MDVLLDQFLDHLSLERGLSDNTRTAYAADIHAFLGFLSRHAVRTVNAVRRKHILDFLMECKRKKLSANSLARRLVAIKVFFRYLHQEGLLNDNVTDEMESPRLWKVLPNTLTLKEVERLLNSPGKKNRYALRDRAMLETLYGTGLRVSELAGLRLDDLHFDEGYVRCVGKGNKERVVPLHASATAYMKEYMEELRPRLTDDPAIREVFVTTRGRKFSRQGIWKMIKTYATQAAITKNVKPHTLRHSFASHLLANGAPLRVIQEMLGHADIATTQVYTHVDPSRLKSVHAAYHPRA